MGEFSRQLLLGVLLSLSTLGAIVAMAQREMPPSPSARREQQTDQAIERLRQQNLINEMMLHHQRMYNMRNEAMWQSFHHQQDMLRSARYDR
jgi:uncharacterized protein (DUF305 family)